MGPVRGGVGAVEAEGVEAGEGVLRGGDGGAEPAGGLGPRDRVEDAVGAQREADGGGGAPGRGKVRGGGQVGLGIKNGGWELGIRD